jgi:hypothetical protein
MSRHEPAMSAGTIALNVSAGVAERADQRRRGERDHPRALGPHLGGRAERRAQDDRREADGVRHVRLQRRHAHREQHGERDDRGAAGHRARGPGREPGGRQRERLQERHPRRIVEG